MIRKQGGRTGRRIKKMTRRESEALFSFHDVQCQIELNNLLFSVKLCFLCHDNNVSHKNTQYICTQLATTHTTMKNVQNQTKFTENYTSTCMHDHIYTVYLCECT